jgi:alpha-methylacyl-CoA racemase
VAGPLDGVKVLELAGLGAGPFAGMLLADLGADVLRLERGDPDASPETTWDLLNRSRPSVAVDLKNEAGRDLALELATSADALIEGFRPGVTERLGLGPAQVHARNPRLVYGRMTGWGQEGPLAQRAGHDINYIAVSGALWPVGRAGEPPVPPLNYVGDFGGGALYLALGVVSALVHARATGVGQVVDAAMVDGSAAMTAMTHSLMAAGFWREERGANILDSGAPFYDVYETSDGRYVAVGAIEAKFYENLLAGLGLDPSELPAQMDRDAWPAMRERFAAIFATRSRDEWVATFEGVDACVSPVLSPTEAPTHPYNVARQVFSTNGATQPRPAPRFSVTPTAISRPPQRAGSGTREGLAAWGVDLERQAQLRAAGAFG